VHRSGIDGFNRAVKDFQLDDQQGQWMKLISKFDGHNRARWIEQQLLNAQSLLADDKRPTAVLAQGVPDARCMVYAAMQQGLRVPQDLSIITYGMADDAQKSPPCLHCVEPDFSSMVQNALGMLRARLAGETVAENSVMILPRLIERNSVAVCASH
jgi:DNA-binding LacI/PurR family transcriptional regulator